jgi:hypothetical protein
MDIGDFKKSYQPIISIVRNGKDDLVADSKSILPSRRNHFSQLLNVHGVKVVRHTEIHTPEPLVPDPRTFEVEMDIEELIHKSLGAYQMPAELIKTGGLF